MVRTRTNAKDDAVDETEEEVEEAKEAKMEVPVKEYDLLKKNNKTLEKNNKTLQRNVDGWKARAEKYKGERDHWKGKYDEILASLKNKRSKGATIKLEQSSEVKGFIATCVKEYLFRNTKFAQPGKETVTAAKKVWAAIKDRHELEKTPTCLNEAEFLRLYSAVVISEISHCRQYSQSRGQQAAQGTSYVILAIFTLNAVY